ncbi:hypothetical protein CEXT_110691 [Caerostris extrusa]|uniref:Uncharacterized protein n=1 Tax=Caerostris extrusa TaxID=172846 RepID=A0AAV4XZN7_CAEEX|nr:hypothetical protein CEXT_110691 [Caerostris extrusa]
MTQLRKQIKHQVQTVILYKLNLSGTTIYAIPKDPVPRSYYQLSTMKSRETDFIRPLPIVANYPGQSRKTRDMGTLITIILLSTDDLKRNNFGIFLFS